MLKSTDELRQELADLRARVKPQDEWTGVQDRLEQTAFAKRIRILQNYLEVLKRSKPLTTTEK